MILEGWFTNKIGDGVAININQTIDSDLTLYAILGNQKHIALVL